MIDTGDLAYELCFQCGMRVLGADTLQFSALTTPADTIAGHFARVDCTECGPTLVDHEGRCVAVDCWHWHGEMD